MKIKKMLICPKCGDQYIGYTEGRVYEDSIDPPHYYCEECGFEGFEHEFLITTYIIEPKNTKKIKFKKLKI